MPMTVEEFKNSLKGMVSVQICPYTKEGEVDIEGIKENTKFIVDFAKDSNKDAALLTNGDTSEWYANSIEEQKKVIKTVVDTVGGVIPVIAGVSQGAVRQTIRMAKYAEELGADCVMSHPPYLHKASKEGVYQYYKTVAESVNIGVMVYNFPNVSGTLIPPDLMARLSKIENIVALKDVTPRAIDNVYNALMIDPEDMVLIDGNGELNYVGSAANGAIYRGFISFIADFAPRQSYSIYEAVKAENFKKAHEALKETFFPLFSFMDRVESSRESISALPWWMGIGTTTISIIKVAMDLVGLRGGPYHPAQLPTEGLTDEEKKDLKGVLKEIGVI